MFPNQGPFSLLVGLIVGTPLPPISDGELSLQKASPHEYFVATVER